MNRKEVTTGFYMKTCTKKLSLVLALAIAVLLVSTSQAAAEGSLDEELEQYWATERDMEVIQERLFERDGRFGVGIFLGLLTSEPFFHYFPVGGRLSYNFSNSLGIEAGGSFMDAGPLHRHTELTRIVTDEYWDEGAGESTFDPALDAEDRFLWRANAMVMWSPFYGKVAALQQKLLHLDLNFGLGMGAVGVERPEPDRSDADNAVAPELVFGTGVHFFLGESLVLRLDGRGYLYRGAELPIHAEDPDDEDHSPPNRWKFPTEFNLGVTYMF